jgi:hypothetical protein
MTQKMTRRRRFPRLQLLVPREAELPLMLAQRMLRPLRSNPRRMRSRRPLLTKRLQFLVMIHQMTLIPQRIPRRSQPLKPLPFNKSSQQRRLSLLQAVMKIAMTLMMMSRSNQRVLLQERTPMSATAKARLLPRLHLLRRPRRNQVMKTKIATAQAKMLLS